MSVDDIQLIDAPSGHKLVPGPDDYAEASPGWTEAEYRARPVGTESIVGFWEGEPGWVRIEEWPYNEICVMLEGSVALEDESGSRREFSAGQAFLVPLGFRGVWHTLTPSRKIFVGLYPDAQS